MLPNEMLISLYLYVHFKMLANIVRVAALSVSPLTF